ncbi:hypothetical protein CK203_018196 [Vitis vinifera]|uniref:DUF4283 domain-containing protein n=1 Tax=Vitis vinifera TaxID=29760 RepID=A0A438JP27_VITVI|nr:hypothetical protein CK203_018196 [Vitis vinifera]
MEISHPLFVNDTLVSWGGEEVSQKASNVGKIVLQGWEAYPNPDHFIWLPLGRRALEWKPHLVRGVIFADDKKALWKRVLSGKNGVDKRGWQSKEVRESYGGEVGFWKDKWCGDELLCTTFPSLFAIVASKDWVVDVWNTGRRVCREDEDKVIWIGLKMIEFRGVVSPVEVMCSHKERTVIRTSTDLVKKDLGVRGIIFLASTRGNVVTNLWSFKGGVKISVFGVALLLFDFVDSTEASTLVNYDGRTMLDTVQVLVRGGREGCPSTDVGVGKEGRPYQFVGIGGDEKGIVGGGGVRLVDPYVKRDFGGAKSRTQCLGHQRVMLFQRLMQSSKGVVVEMWLRGKCCCQSRCQRVPCVVIINEALVVKVNSFLELLRSVVKDPSNKKWVVRTKELKAFHAMELTCVSKGEDLDSLPSKFVNFSNYEGMPMAGFGKEINPFLKILESRKGKKGHGAKFSDHNQRKGRSAEDSTPIL